MNTINAKDSVIFDTRHSPYFLEISNISLHNFVNNAPRLNNGFPLFLRIPDWVEENEAIVRINDEPYAHNAVSGSYLKIHHGWCRGTASEWSD